MSRGISKIQRKILELVAIPGEPAGLPREVIQAQLWPDLFQYDYRGTSKSSEVVRKKRACRVTLSRAIASLIRRGLVAEKDFDGIAAAEVSRRGLVLPYQMDSFYTRSVSYGYLVAPFAPPTTDDTV